MYRSEYIVCFRSEISFVPLLFSHRTPFLRPYWQIYFNSTSNHNTLQNYHNAYGVVSYFHFTSNHNIRLFRHRFIRLFLISILHQTTTNTANKYIAYRLFLISILHQTTTSATVKPSSPPLFLISILHQTTTGRRCRPRPGRLFLISILHQTTTSDMRFVDCHSVMWPNERYERRMTGQGSRNDAGFEYIYFYW